MNKVILSLSLFAVFGVFVTGCQQEMSSDSEQMVQEVKAVAHYVDYSAEKMGMRIGEKTILFFYADWCPPCRNWEKAIKNEMLPEGALVLKVDYDTEEDLKVKYGVKSQSTAVFINADGIFELLSDPGMDKVQDFFMMK